MSGNEKDDTKEEKDRTTGSRMMVSKSSLFTSVFAFCDYFLHLKTEETPSIFSRPCDLSYRCWTWSLPIPFSFRLFEQLDWKRNHFNLLTKLGQTATIKFQAGVANPRPDLLLSVGRRRRIRLQDTRVESKQALNSDLIESRYRAVRPFTLQARHHVHWRVSRNELDSDILHSKLSGQSRRLFHSGGATAVSDKTPIIYSLPPL
ncbi:hypothetical protein PGT21_026313 [Puccinia graminis f. sp. tritici]|uniref:Uncharacterized protein n=1 Tax=Puccinia graminis f. sp. tritici TaxID=56615 RepID=A0A5B0M7M0_PUCGR|nr:hypothetical protein PGT21_026313 [Puccinia graminis f. sp. tritici]